MMNFIAQMNPKWGTYDLLKVDSFNSKIRYYGGAKSSKTTENTAAWLICRETQVAGVRNYEYASTNHDQKWTNRATLFTAVPGGAQDLEETLSFDGEPIKKYSQAIKTKVNVALASVKILDANANRQGLVIFNNSSNSTYLSYGVASIAAECAEILTTFNQMKMTGPGVYTGEIHAIRNAGTGNCVCWELLP